MFGDVTLYSLHSLKSGNCFINLPPKPEANSLAVFDKAYLVTPCIALDAPDTTGFASFVDPRYTIGLNTRLSTPFAPILAVVPATGLSPYL